MKTYGFQQAMAIRVLVVEDNPLNMELVTDLLESQNYLVLQAATAEDGIALAIRELPDLILMDISLPGMDGMEATQLLKRHEQAGGIPVIFLTAHAMKNDRTKALDAGGDGFITKPIDTHAFLLTIKELLKRGPYEKAA